MHGLQTLAGKPEIRMEKMGMNKKALEKSVGQQVRLRPIARRFEGDKEQPQIDDPWIIQHVTKDGVHLLNTRTNHCPTLGFDHIFGYTSDPDRSRGSEVHGLLQLTVQLILRGDEVLNEPTRRPGESNTGPITFSN